MRNVSRSLAMACVPLLCGVLAASSVFAQSVLDQYNEARPKIQRLLRARSVDSRLDALREMRKYPVAEVARLAHGCFVDKDEDVRHAAYATLLAINGEREVCDTLVELANKGMKKRDWPSTVPPALAALLSSNLPRARLRIQKLMDEKIATSSRGPQVALAIADGLGAHGQPEDVLPLSRLSKTKLFADHFGVRRGVVGGLTQIPNKEAVGALIAMMDRVGGEARADASEHLAKVTGQIFGMDAGAWARWWEQDGATFEYPNLSASESFRRAAESPGGYYYGLPLFADRLVFVLDTSGSMQGPRMLAAKRELIKAINGLPDHVHFGVVFFNQQVGSWKKVLQPADKKMKAAAVEFIERLTPRNNTASYNALEAALKYDTEAIYFLSDGAPTSGKILAPVDIVSAVSTTNQVRRITIYTIGIAPGFPGSPTDAFLKALAEQNFGQYRRVDG